MSEKDYLSAWAGEIFAGLCSGKLTTQFWLAKRHRRADLRSLPMTGAEHDAYREKYHKQ